MLKTCVKSLSFFFHTYKYINLSHYSQKKKIEIYIYINISLSKKIKCNKINIKKLIIIFKMCRKIIVIISLNFKHKTQMIMIIKIIR
jgi:hypothetical protein